MAKKITKKNVRTTFLTGSVADTTDPHISVYYDAPCNQLNLIINYGEMRYSELQTIIGYFTLELNSQTKIKVYHA